MDYSSYVKNNISNGMDVMKLISFIFCVLIYCRDCVTNSGLVVRSYNTKMLIAIFCGILLIYGAWIISYIKMLKPKYIKVKKNFQIIESFMFIFMFTFFIATLNSNAGEYKLLFLLIIMSSSYQFGIKYGEILAVTYGLIMIFCDFAHISGNPFQLYIEEDLTISMIYIVIVSVIGYYRGIQQYNIKIKDKQLDYMNNIINTKDKSKCCVIDMLTKSKSQVKELKNDLEKNIELLSNIAHEIKTPLNVIFSSIQVIEQDMDSVDQKCDDKNQKYIKIMKQNCYKLMKLVNNLIDVTKLNCGFLKLDMHNKNIVSLVENIVDSVVPYVESRGINLTFDTDVEEKIIAVDSDKIERIILNLLSNAIKFTKQKGSIFVNIISENDSVLISVEDTGIGIPEDKINMIFKRFQQVENLYRGNSEGSGIGLYLVKSLVELHGGKIYIESNYGKGSKFTVKLPVHMIKEDKMNASMDLSNFNYEDSKHRINIEFSDTSIKI